MKWGRFAEQGAFVVIVGSPLHPMVRSLELDLERRGFIVFTTVGTGEERQAVEAEGRGDIRALDLQIVDVSNPLVLLCY